jgi:SAM-dependent methyltransferase
MTGAAASVSCPTCESTRSTDAFEKGGYAYRRCPDCRCLFVAGDLNAAAVYANYSEAYYESDASTNDERHGYPSYRGARDSLDKGFAARVDLVRQYVEGGSLLEAGAAYGFFLKAAEPHFDVAGVEVSAYAAEVARRETQVPVVHGSIEQAGFPDHRFDVVVMWDVIEHLMRPLDALREIRRLLKPGGYLFVSTDDASHWLPRRLGLKWWGLAPPLHLCHFSKDALRAASRIAGLEAPIFLPDPRYYTVPEVITHFGESYQSGFLKTLGGWGDRTWLGRRPIRVSRPEQFVAVIRSPALT